jgi:glycosyltransferase involved in cell wall biosynthesis
MISPTRPVAVIPAYDAAARIGATIDGLLDFVAGVIVVDDGSLDETGNEAAKRSMTEVIRQARSGPGAAVHNGLCAARQAGAEFAVVVDADGQMDATRIPDLIRPLQQGDADLVRGDRLAPDSGGDAMPLIRLMAAHCLRLPASLCARQTVRDPLSGFVALRLSLLPEGLWPGFGYPVHLAAAVAAQGGRIVQLPVPACYPSDGVSHHGVHRLPSVLGALAAAVGERLR